MGRGRELERKEEKIRKGKWEGGRKESGKGRRNIEESGRACGGGIGGGE